MRDVVKGNLINRTNLASILEMKPHRGVTKGNFFSRERDGKGRYRSFIC